MTLYTENHRNPRNRDGTIDHRACFDAFEVLSESRTHWAVGPPYQPRKVNKRTMESAKDWQGRHPRWFTEAQLADEVWKREHRSAIRNAVEKADTATLRQIHALLGLAP